MILRQRCRQSSLESLLLPLARQTRTTQRLVESLSCVQHHVAKLELRSWVSLLATPRLANRLSGSQRSTVVQRPTRAESLRFTARVTAQLKLTLWNFSLENTGACLI